CSAKELELGEDHDGIIELPGDAPIGTPYPDYAGLTDPVIDVSVTPNKQDCMGVRGIARDLAAAGMGRLRPPAPVSLSVSGAGPVIATEDPDGCPAFYGQIVRGVTNGPAPEWLQRRLKAIGQKPISALVDITNYVMFDLGRPLHVYDMAKLDGGLVARQARNGESVVALNGKSYALAPGMTVIADATKVHDIAGIMGGEETGVSEATTNVLIECAYFDPETIARTGQKLMLTSDARTRFERGVDPAFLDEGLAIAAALVVELCGGTASEVTRAGTPPVTTRAIAYDPARAEALGGLAIAPERQRAILESLGFSVSTDWQVTPPSWRRDVESSPDLVEEVIRIEGIDKVPPVPLPRAPGVARPTATPDQKLERRVRRAAAARGLNEAITWSFLPEAHAAVFRGTGNFAWTLANPISEDLKVMRPALLPGLLSAAARNLKRGASSVRLFELGRRYLNDVDRMTLGAVLAGNKAPRNWQSGKAQAFDAFDAKAEALALLAEAGVPTDSLQVFAGAGDAWHPGQSGTLRLGPKTVLAAFGMLHPLTLKAFDLDGAVAAVELYLDAIPAKRAGGGFMRPAYTPPPLHAVTRDFAFLVPGDLAADALVRAIRGADKKAIAAARLFDRFERDGQKSLAIEVTLQPIDNSFTDGELKAIGERVVAAAAKLGATLRG
ncbi:MAG: phenylalanine--tRNA ligase subunit beta, partial [Sphingomonas hengshuiensis]